MDHLAASIGSGAVHNGLKDGALRQQIGEQTSAMFSRRQPCVSGRSLALVLEPALEDNFAFLAVSCGFALASKSLLSSGIIWRSRLADASWVVVVVDDVLWINRFSLGMHASHWAI